MADLVYHTSGESHGPGLIAMVQGLPSGVAVDLNLINGELRRRQGGYGRGGRQKIETDIAEVLSGVRKGETIGSPVSLFVKNKDSRLDDDERTPVVSRPRPGHADLAGSIKWLTTGLPGDARTGERAGDGGAGGCGRAGEVFPAGGGDRGVRVCAARAHGCDGYRGDGG